MCYRMSLKAAKHCERTVADYALPVAMSDETLPAPTHRARRRPPELFQIWIERHHL